MPKIQINRQKVHQFNQVDTSSPVSTQVYEMVDPVLHVCWLNSDIGAGHVQFKAEFDSGWLQEQATKAVAANTPFTELWFPTLDRGEINAAIRALRTARDKAMGPDV